MVEINYGVIMVSSETVWRSREVCKNLWPSRTPWRSCCLVWVLKGYHKVALVCVELQKQGVVICPGNWENEAGIRPRNRRGQNLPNIKQGSRRKPTLLLIHSRQEWAERSSREFFSIIEKELPGNKIARFFLNETVLSPFASAPRKILSRISCPSIQRKSHLRKKWHTFATGKLYLLPENDSYFSFGPDKWRIQFAKDIKKYEFLSGNNEENSLLILPGFTSIWVLTSNFPDVYVIPQYRYRVRWKNWGKKDTIYTR